MNTQSNSLRLLTRLSVVGSATLATLLFGLAPANGVPENAEPTAEPTTTPPVDPDAPSDTGAFKVNDAQFRWGVNNESNNRAFAPGTFNFLAAGEAPDPGAGSQTIDPKTGKWRSNRTQAWRAQVGKVRIEKMRPNGSYSLATLGGLSTDSAGKPLPSATSGRFSGHQVVINGGTGAIDPTAGTATIRWKGTFSVIFYSGMSFFFVSDPTLEVTKSKAEVTATLGGYASDMADMTKWAKAKPQRVVLATLPRQSLTLPRSGGFNSTPAYRNVKYSAGNQTPQVRTTPHWGAFPTSFLNYVGMLGQGSYWYSSGGAADPYKVATPLTVSYSAGAPITVPKAPPAPGGDTSTPTQPQAPPPPPSGPSAPSGTAPLSNTATGTTMSSVPMARPNFTATGNPDTATPLDPVAAITAPVAALTGQPGPVPTAYALTGDANGSKSSSRPWEWWLGAVLLLGAVVISPLRKIVKGKR